jgi:D-aminoacyl-tRNA deacylase
MKAVIQRVSSASVTVNGESIGSIQKGLVVLLGVSKDDTDKDLDWLMTKIIHLRIFANEDGKFDQSLMDIAGEILLVSQFTLLADCRKGRRPGFDNAAEPNSANEMYLKSIAWLQARNIPTQTGKFGAMMRVSLSNDGPVTIILDSKNP